MATNSPHSIYNEIISAVAQNKDKISSKKKQEPAPVPTYTQADFRNDVTNEKKLIGLLGQRWKTNLALLRSFVELYQYLTGRKQITEIPISTTSKSLIRIFKDHQKVSRVLQLACMVDLLKCTREKFRFGPYETYCKTYIYNKVVQDLIKKVAVKYGIKFTEHIVVNCVPDNITCDQTRSCYFVRGKGYRLFFSSRLRIPNMTDEECIELLYSSYPFLSDYQRLADEMNRTYLHDCPEQQIVFQPSITRSKTGCITKIGIRATSPICNLKEHENANMDYRGLWRKDYLREFFGTDKIYSYDVKSSIYRVSHLMNYSEWADDSVDFYEEIYGKAFSSPAERTMFKDFCQRLYFDSARMVYSHTRDCYADLIAKGVSEQDIKQAISEMKKNMEYKLGNLSMRSEVFFHESCIYLDLVERLRSSGIRVVQIYDGFYSDQDIGDYCRFILPDVAAKYVYKVVDSMH